MDPVATGGFCSRQPPGHKQRARAISCQMKERIYISHSPIETRLARRLAPLVAQAGYHPVMSQDLDISEPLRSRRVRPAIEEATGVMVLFTHLHTGSKESNTDVLIAAGIGKPCLALLVGMDHVQACKEAAPLLRRLGYAVRVEEHFDGAVSALRTVLHHFAVRAAVKKEVQAVKGGMR